MVVLNANPTLRRVDGIDPGQARLTLGAGETARIGVAPEIPGRRLARLDPGTATRPRCGLFSSVFLRDFRILAEKFTRRNARLRVVIDKRRRITSICHQRTTSVGHLPDRGRMKGVRG